MKRNALITRKEIEEALREHYDEPGLYRLFREAEGFRYYFSVYATSREEWKNAQLIEVRDAPEEPKQESEAQGG